MVRVNGVVRLFGLLVFSALSHAADVGELPQGSFFRPCWKGDLELSTEETMTFEGRSVHVQRLMTVQPTCAVFDIEFEGKADITQFGDPVEGLDGVFSIDAQWTSVRVRVLSVTAAGGFNKQSVCGYNDWKSGEWKDVSGKTCRDLRAPKVGEGYYQIYQMGGEELGHHEHFSPPGDRIVFGDSEEKSAAGEKLDCSHPKLRPRTLDMFSIHYLGVPDENKRPKERNEQKKKRKRAVIG